MGDCWTSSWADGQLARSFVSPSSLRSRAGAPVVSGRRPLMMSLVTRGPDSTIDGITALCHCPQSKRTDRAGASTLDQAGSKNTVRQTDAVSSPCQERITASFLVEHATYRVLPPQLTP